MGFAPPPHGNLQIERYVGNILIPPCSQPQQLSPPPPHFQDLLPGKYPNQHHKKNGLFRVQNRPFFRDAHQQQGALKHDSKRAGGGGGIDPLIESVFFLNGGGPVYDGYGAQKSQIKQSAFKDHILTRVVAAEETAALWNIGVPLIQPPALYSSVGGSAGTGNKPKNNRFKKNRKQDFFAPNFIVGVTDPRMQQPPVNRSQFSKLAFHTQGVPLIQSGRYEQYSRPKNHKALCNSSTYNRVYRGGGGSQTGEKLAGKTNKIAVPQSNKKELSSSKITECLSVNSDENLSCNSLENSLPRIIKPRKRRKKDRKPNGTTVNSSDQSTPDDTATKDSSASSKELHATNATVPAKVSANVSARIDQGNVEEAARDKQESLNASSISKAVKFVLVEENVGGVGVFDGGNSSTIERSFDEIISRGEKENPDTFSSCQCRYCDPCSLIWNVNTRGYSPSLLAAHDFLRRDPCPASSSSFPDRISGKASVSADRDPSHNHVSGPDVKFPLINGGGGGGISSQRSDVHAFKLPPPFHQSPPPALKKSSTASNGGGGGYPPSNLPSQPCNVDFPNRFPPRNNPQFHSPANLLYPSRSGNLNNFPDPISPRNALSENDRLVHRSNSFSGLPNKANFCSDVYNNRCGSARPPMDQYPSQSDFTKKFGFLNVSNFQNVPAPTMIDTSRPPPPIPSKFEEPRFHIPEQSPPSSIPANFEEPRFHVPEQPLPSTIPAKFEESRFHIPEQPPPPTIPAKFEEPRFHIPEQLSHPPTFNVTIQRTGSWKSHRNDSGGFHPSCGLRKESESLSPGYSNSPPKFPGSPIMKESRSLNHRHQTVDPLKAPGAPLRAEGSEPSAVGVELTKRNSQIDFESSSPPSTGAQNLQVSSQIVTSPNGHRDIEIKFFMSSTPPSSPVSSFLSSPMKSMAVTPSLEYSSALNAEVK